MKPSDTPLFDMIPEEEAPLPEPNLVITEVARTVQNELPDWMRDDDKKHPFVMTQWRLRKSR